MLSEIERIEAILQEFLSIAKTDEINTEQKIFIKFIITSYR